MSVSELLTRVRAHASFGGFRLTLARAWQTFVVAYAVLIIVFAVGDAMIFLDARRVAGERPTPTGNARVKLESGAITATATLLDARATRYADIRERGIEIPSPFK